MPPRRELCKNFNSGSCRYGDRCKFVHESQQQPKSNPFGFGSQTATRFQQTSTQQQKPNPFGFGVQNSGPANGRQPNAFKPFENKWTRSEQPANQSQTASHDCTKPDACKHQMAEDFKNEKPLWGLTCYGHCKSLPCDITGDISFEELRAEAYSDGQRGVSIQSIIERERNLWNSKLAEFQNLLQKPLAKHTQPAPNQSLFPAVGAKSPLFAPQNNGPSPFSGFGSQPASSPNMTFGVRPSTPSNSGFAQFQGTTVPPGSFGTQNPAQADANPFASNLPGFGNSGMSTQSTQFPVQAGGNPFTSSMASLGNSGMMSQGNQVPVQTGGNPFTSNISGFTNSGMGTQGSQFPSMTTAISQSPVLSNGVGATNATEQSNAQLEVTPADPGIWLKEEWKLGEIPEQPPPAAYVK